MRRGRWLLPGVAMAAVVAIAAVVWQVHETRVAWTTAVPPAPDLAAFPGELRERVADLTARAAQRDVGALGELGRVYQANGFAQEAARTYEGLLLIDAANPRWAHLLAHLLAGHGQLAEAANLWRRAVKAAPDYLPARLRWAEALLKTNDAAAAAAVYADAVAAAPQDPYALLGLARCELQLDRLTAARERLQQAVAAQPEFGAGWHLLATVYERLGNAGGAATARSRAALLRRFREMPDPWLEALAADCYDIYRLRVVAAAARNAGDARGALPWLERAERLAPVEPAVQLDMGDTWMELHEFARAQAAFARAAELAPGQEAAYLRWFAACTTAGDAGAAAEAIAVGLRQCPESSALHFAHGRWLSTTERWDGALAAFEAVTQLKPAGPDAYHEMAAIHFRLGRDAQGIACLTALLAQVPDHRDTVRALARRGIELGDSAAATHWLERLQKSPGAADADTDLLDRFRRRFGPAP